MREEIERLIGYYDLAVKFAAHNGLFERQQCYMRVIEDLKRILSANHEDN